MCERAEILKTFLSLNILNFDANISHIIYVYVHEKEPSIYQWIIDELKAYFINVLEVHNDHVKYKLCTSELPPGDFYFGGEVCELCHELRRYHKLWMSPVEAKKWLHTFLEFEDVI